jgi:hypothetical protein
VLHLFGMKYRVGLFSSSNKVTVLIGRVGWKISFHVCGLERVLYRELKENTFSERDVNSLSLEWRPSGSEIFISLLSVPIGFFDRPA